MDKKMIFIVISLLFFIVLITSFAIYKKKKKEKYKSIIEKLEYEKNQLVGVPILTELSKVRELVKTDILKEKLKEWDNTFKEIKENINQIKDILNLNLESNIDRYKTNTNKFSTISSENLNITNINGKQEPILLNNNSNNVLTEKELLNCVEKIIYNNILNIPESTDNISINYKNEKLENFINIIVSQVILNKDDSIIYEKSINEPQNIFTVENELAARNIIINVYTFLSN